MATTPRHGAQPPDEPSDTKRRQPDEPVRRSGQPEQRAGETPTQFAAPTYPVITEGPHNTEFVLSEANGNRSRDNAYLADPITILPGTPLKKTAAATTDRPATYIVATAGADCQAIALYGGKSIPVDGLRVSIIARDAVVNLRLINWGAMSTGEQVTGVATLAAAGIIARV